MLSPPSLMNLEREDCREVHGSFKLFHVWIYCYRTLKYMFTSYPGMQLGCGQGVFSSTGAEM